MDRVREDLLALFRAAVGAAMPERVMPPPLPRPAGRLCVIAAGKAAAEMMRVAEARSGAPLHGLAVTRYGHVPPDYAPGPGVRLIEAGHPAPDANSLLAGRAALELARALGPGDLLLTMLSGGGSSLLAVPAPGIGLPEKQAATRALLASGASIAEINLVRKHLSAIKGGRLAAAAAPARVETWIISDVPGDDPALVASGPTLPDASTAADARAVLETYGLSPLPLADSPPVAAGPVRILATAEDALAAAAAEARSRGYSARILGQLEGEARALGEAHAAVATPGERRAILSGGETIVTVGRAPGRGGRNLEYLLALAIALDGAPGVSAIAADTDGIDGTGPAAGAMLFPDSLERARALGLDPADHLARNDALSVFEALGDLVVTGPTLTNVNDFRAILVA